MKLFVLTTRSESGDDYSYLIKARIRPTSKQIDNFLMEHGTDVDDDECFEQVVVLEEVDESQAIPLEPVTEESE